MTLVTDYLTDLDNKKLINYWQLSLAVNAELTKENNMQNKGFQIENYVVHPSGTVWCVQQNEMIYSSTYEDCVEFVNNITS